MSSGTRKARRKPTPSPPGPSHSVRLQARTRIAGPGPARSLAGTRRSESRCRRCSAGSGPRSWWRTQSSACRRRSHSDSSVAALRVRVCAGPGGAGPRAGRVSMPQWYSGPRLLRLPVRRRRAASPSRPAEAGHVRRSWYALAARAVPLARRATLRAHATPAAAAAPSRGPSRAASAAADEDTASRRRPAASYRSRILMARLRRRAAAGFGQSAGVTVALAAARPARPGPGSQAGAPLA